MRNTALRKRLALRNHRFDRGEEHLLKACDHEKVELLAPMLV